MDQDGEHGCGRAHQGGGGGQPPGNQSRVCDARLRRPRKQGPDQTACRHARTDDQAVRRDHRAADSVQFPGRPHGAGILHQHPRRPQGTGRYGSEDRGLRLHDPQAGRRRAGHHLPLRRLRNAQGHLCGSHYRRRRDHASAQGQTARTLQRAGHPRSRQERRKLHYPRGRRVYAGKSRPDRKARHHQGADPLGSDLRRRTRRLREMLRQESCHGQGCGNRRRARHYRRAVDRRARNAADHENVPHRRNFLRRRQGACHHGAPGGNGPI